MRVWQTAVLATPALAAVGFGAAVLWFSRRWIMPPRVVFQPPAEEHLQEARFRSTDGTPLTGWFLPGDPGRPALVLCHGYQRSMEETFSIGVDLRQQGFTVLLFDFRGCGRSGGRYTTIGDFEADDLRGAVRWLRRRLGGTTPIGVLGISMGGAVALRAAAECDDIGAVVADSAFAHLTGCVAQRFQGLRFPMLHLNILTMRTAERLCGGRVDRVRPVDLVARIAPRPVFFIHGTADGIVPYSHHEELLTAAREPKTAWSLPGSTHAMARLDAPAEYLARVSGFFTAALEERQEQVAS